MIRNRRDAQSFGALGHRRVVDRLDVDAVVGKEQIARLFAALGIADEDRNDVVGLNITGSRAAESTALVRAARS